MITAVNENVHFLHVNGLIYTVGVKEEVAEVGERDVGFDVGLELGDCVGLLDGSDVGEFVGKPWFADGLTVGYRDGPLVGLDDGVCVWFV